MTLTKRSRKNLYTLIIMLVFIGLSAVFNKFNLQSSILTQKTFKNNPVVTGTYRVTKIDDGDTIVIDMDGKNETVRMIGVDTPEVKDPRKPIQCFGETASNFTKTLIGTNTVRLEADPQNTNRDRYNRLLRYVYLPNNLLVNAEIIKQGYGFAYTGFPFNKKQQFIQLQENAKSNNLGLWNKCQPIINQYGGYSSNPE